MEALPNESEGHAMLAEIRALEPTGLMRLAEAQVSAGKTGEAVMTWKKVLAKEWPSRVGNVGDQARRRMEEVGR